MRSLLPRTPYPRTPYSRTSYGRTSHSRPVWAVAVLLCLLLIASGCGERPGDAGIEQSADTGANGPGSGVRTDNQALGISLASLPDAFRVATNEGDELVLVPADPQLEGSLRISVGPKKRGINLVAAVDRHKLRIEHLPAGHFLGRTELGSHLGVAFLSRGRYEEDDAQVEQVSLFVIHPDGSRRLDLTYTYPAGDDSSERAQQLLGVFAEVEAYTPPAQ